MYLSAPFWNLCYEQPMMGFVEIDNTVELVLLHERKAASIEDVGISDAETVVNITEGSHSILALTKKAELSHFLITVLWCWFGPYPHGHQLVICLTSKNLSDLTLFMVKLQRNASSFSFGRNCFLPSMLYTSFLISQLHTVPLCFILSFCLSQHELIFHSQK